MNQIHTHVCRCGERYECPVFRYCKNRIGEGDGVCPRHRAWWNAIFRRFDFEREFEQEWAHGEAQETQREAER